jgi:hypothetical protein
MRTLVMLIVGAMGVAAAGCSSSDGRSARLVNRPATETGTPFGGGFPPSQRPDGDPFGKETRRNEVRFEYDGDNGAPETRVDPRVDRRTQ